MGNLVSYEYPPDGGPAGPLLEEPPAKDVPILPEDVQQQVQPEAAHPQHAHGGPGAGLRDLPEEGEEQVVSEETPCHPPRRTAQEVRIRLDLLLRSGQICFTEKFCICVRASQQPTPVYSVKPSANIAISPVPTTQS